MSEGTEARRLAEGARDRVRFEEEALELSDQVYRVARRLVGSREEAEDLMQEAYARAFRSWRQYQQGTNMQPLEESDYYLYDKLAESSGDGNPAEDRVIERLSQDNVVEALSEVPHDFRDVVVLVDIGEFSYADAAQILDVPIGTVMSRLHRGRRILKTQLADASVGDS